VSVVVPVNLLELNINRTSLKRGDRITLHPTIYPADATDKNVLYTTSDSLVATVSQDGAVHAVGAGTATIRCTAADSGFSATCSITVTVPAVPVTRISVNTDQSSYKVGEQVSYTVQVYPEEATDGTITVEISGEITLLDKNTFICETSGEITITATAANGVTGRRVVDVHDAPQNSAVDTGTDTSAYANEVIRLVNIERQNAGLNPLTQTPELTKAAEARAKDLTILYSHTRPDKSECWSAYDENNVTYSIAAENIASGHKTPESVMKDWMNSPGHRANILNAEFEHLGVGVALDQDDRHFWAQEFTD
jgi:uncharacterized protein YkwD